MSVVTLWQSRRYKNLQAVFFFFNPWEQNWGSQSSSVRCHRRTERNAAINRVAPTGLSVALQRLWNRLYFTHNIWNTAAVFLSESLRPGGEGRRRGATHHLLLIHVSHTKPDIKHRSVMRLSKHSSAHWMDQGRAEARAQKQIDPSFLLTPGNHTEYSQSSGFF